MNWTDERVELLKKLWAEGLSASQVASQLGGVSRNAVIGKVHRLKLAGRGRSSSASPRPKKVSSGGQGKPSRPSRQVSASLGNTALKARFEAEPQFEEEREPFESIVIPIPLKLKLVELSERTCKWPIGDPLSEDFAFCGNDVGECGPYCTYHSRLAYQPAAERRKSR
jgi:GcrA cell cycle regulator